MARAGREEGGIANSQLDVLGNLEPVTPAPLTHTQVWEDCRGSECRECRASAADELRRHLP
eukprot:1786787-Lingulodinium_polyedra.AAC.1